MKETAPEPKAYLIGGSDRLFTPEHATVYLKCINILKEVEKNNPFRQASYLLAKIPLNTPYKDLTPAQKETMKTKLVAQKKDYPQAIDSLHTYNLEEVKVKGKDYYKLTLNNYLE